MGETSHTKHQFPILPARHSAEARAAMGGGPLSGVSCDTLVGAKAAPQEKGGERGVGPAKIGGPDLQRSLAATQGT
ncbi:unnamed protein product [Arctogadus glacialis]